MSKAGIAMRPGPSCLGWQNVDRIVNKASAQEEASAPVTARTKISLTRNIESPPNTVEMPVGYLFSYVEMLKVRVGFAQVELPWLQCCNPFGEFNH